MLTSEEMKDIFQKAREVMKDYEELLDILDGLKSEENSEVFVVYIPEKSAEDSYDAWTVQIC